MIDKTSLEYRKLFLTVNSLQLRGVSLGRIADEIECAAIFEPEEQQQFLKEFVMELRSRCDD